MPQQKQQKKNPQKASDMGGEFPKNGGGFPQPTIVFFPY